MGRRTIANGIYFQDTAEVAHCEQLEPVRRPVARRRVDHEARQEATPIRVLPHFLLRQRNSWHLYTLTDRHRQFEVA